MWNIISPTKHCYEAALCYAYGAFVLLEGTVKGVASIVRIYFIDMSMQIRVYYIGCPK